MRAYFFGNMYLSSIQQGIQALHCLGEMHNKYDYRVTSKDVGVEYCTEQSKQKCMLREWEEDHKTVILLNAGFSETIRELHTFFYDGIKKNQNPYPFASFTEGEDALDGALTCVGIILPEKIYLTMSLLRKQTGVGLAATLREEGQFTVKPNNNDGFTVSEETAIKFNKWELDLMDKISGFGLAQ